MDSLVNQPLVVSYLYKRILVVLVPLILVLGVVGYIGSIAIPTAHAATTGFPGLVCLNDASVASPTTPCQNSGTNPTPFVFNAPFPPSPETAPEQIRVGVYLQNSTGTDGFTVILTANFNILHPAGVDLSNTLLLGTPVVLAECLSGNIIQGSACSGADNVTTLELSATSELGKPNTVTPTTGLLFTAIYNVTGATPAGGIPISFQTSAAFCGATSVPGNVCVTIANGNPVNDAENIQTGTMFNNNACVTTCDWFNVVGNVTSVPILNQGATSGNHVLLTATAPNGLPVLGTSYVNFSSVVTFGFAGPLIGGAPTFQCSTFTANQCMVTATFSTAVAGSYSVTIFGKYVMDDSSLTTTWTVFAVVNFQITVRGVNWIINGQGATSSPFNNYFKKGATSMVNTFISGGGYSGTVTLVQSVCSPGTTGVVCTPAIPLPPPFTVGAGQTVTKLINFTSTAYGRFLYRDSMSATDLPTVTGTTESIFVSGFSMVSNTTAVSFNSGGSAGVLVTFTGLGAPTFQFNGAVSIGATGNSTSAATGVKVSCNPTSVQIVSPSLTATAACSLSSSVPTTTDFAVNINGTGGTNNAMTNSTGAIAVHVVGTVTPGFSLSATNNNFNSGASGSTSVSVKSLNGFSGTVSITGSSTPSGVSVTPCSATVASGGTATATCALSSSTSGVYSVALSGSGGSPTVTNSTVITVHIGDFTVSAASNDVSFNTGVSTTTDVLTLTSTQNFAGIVNVAGVGTGLTISCTSVTLAANGTGASTCTIVSSSPGLHSATLTSTAATGTASHSLTITVHVGDFTVSAASSDISFNTGVSSTTDVLTLTSTQNFAGTVNVAGTLSGLTVTCTSATLAANGTATSTCTISSSTPGIYSLTVTATAGTGTASHAVVIVVHVGDFSISASSASGNAGASLTSTITLTSTQNWAGAVNLSDIVPSGLSCGVLSATSVTLTANGTSSTTTLTCTSSTAGSFTVPVTGTAATGFGTATHSANAPFSFGAPAGFSLSATGSSFNSGATGSTTVTVTSLHGFSGTVSITGTSAPNGVTVTPCSATVASGGTATAACSLSSSTGGVYAVMLNGSGGSPTVTNSTVITVHVGDFTAAAASSDVSLNTGASTTDNVNLASTQNWAGTVNVAGTGTGLTISCTSATLTANGTVSSTCTISSSSPGVHSATLTASAATGFGTSSHTVTITVHAGDFTATAASSDVSFNTGASTTDNVNLASIQNWAGTVNVAGSVTGLTVSCTSPTLTANGTAASTCTISSSTPGLYSLTLTASAGTGFGTASHSVTITVHVGDFTISASPQSGNAGASLTSTITLTSTQNWAGTVNLSDTVPSGLSCGALSATSVTLTANSTSSTTTLTCTSATTGSFTVVVTGAAATGFGSASRNANAVFTFGQAPGFSLTSTNSNFNVGASGSTSVTVTSLNGFSGTVSITGSSTPSGVTVTPCSATVASGGTATAACSLSSSIGGVYAVTLNGSGGSPALTNSTIITVHVGDFTVSAASSDISFNTGASTTDVLTLTSTQNFAGTVNVAGTLSGLTVICTSATLAANGTATSTCTISSSTPGIYSLTVTATAATGTASHAVTITVHVGDFTIAATSQTGNVGASLTSTFTLTSSQNWAGTVNLSDTVPSGLSCGALSATSVTLTANSTSSTTTLTCTSSSTGSFTVPVTGTAAAGFGTASHATDAAFTFGQAPGFSLSATNSNFNVGASGSTSVTVTSLNGFSGTVSITGSSTPSGVTVTPCSATVASGGTATAACALSSSTSGVYSVALSGSGGGVNNSTAITVHVGDFTVSATSENGNAGASLTSTITLTSTQNWAGTVNLSDTVPSGLSCGALSATSVSLTANSTSSATTVMCVSSTGGAFTLVVTGTAASGFGTASHSTNAVFTFGASQDFSITANPTTVNAVVNSPATSTITLSPLNGFTSDVALFSDNSACNLSPSIVTGGSGTSTLSCTFAAEGSVTVTVTGVSGLLFHNATVTFSVGPVIKDDTSTSVSCPSSVSVGLTDSCSVTVVDTTNVANVASGTVNLVSSDVTIGTVDASCTLDSSGGCTVTITGVAAGSFTVTGNYAGDSSHNTSSGISVAITVVAPVKDSTSTLVVCAPSLISVGQTSTCTATVSDLNSTSNIPSGTVSFASSNTAVGTVGASCTLGSTGSCSVTFTGVAPGNATVTGTYSGDSSHKGSSGTSGALSVTPVTGQKDFTISANPTALTVTGESALCEGGSTLCDDEGSTTITLSSVNGFNSTVRLVRSVSPDRGMLTVYCRPGAVQLKPGATVTVKCFVEPEINPDSPTTFRVTITAVTAVTRSPSHSVVFTVTVTHFSAPSENDPIVSSFAPLIALANVGSVGAASVAGGVDRVDFKGKGHAYGYGTGQQGENDHTQNGAL